MSYVSPCGSEAARKQVGSYYTPADAAMFFWDQYMSLNDLCSRSAIVKFWSGHHFIEPAAGAGALIFSLFKKSVEAGLPIENLSTVEMTIVDINSKALDFVQEQLESLAEKWGLSLRGIRYSCTDFRVCKVPVSPKKPLFFGNPPFVKNPRGSLWKNLFADFLDRAVRQTGPEGKIHFILPLSIAFSRDYKELRNDIRMSGKNIALSSFDNIPDTLFSSGKPEHINTNKANSQRCAILTVYPSNDLRVFSTRMHRWSKQDRSKLLSSRPHYYDVTKYSFDDQFPRPESKSILEYLKDSAKCARFQSLTTRCGPYTLNVAGVARNFIGFRDTPSSGVHQLQFKTEQALYSAILILSSGLFLEYWRTVGDGFHVTQKNLMEFPLHPKLLACVEKNITKGKRMWNERYGHAKNKRHPTGTTTSFDFNSVALKMEI